MTDRDARSLYLDLIRRDLTRYGMDQLVPVGWSQEQRLTLGWLLGRPFFKVGNLMLVRKKAFDKRRRDLGLDWPIDAETMIGMQRLTSLQQCVQTVLAEDVPGDLVECGVWRGGAAILMRAVLAAYGDTTRSVWLADSFEGVPPPDTENYKADKLPWHNMGLHRFAPVLAVSQEQVKANFERYGLLDGQVRFLPGWFKDTLHDAPIERISVLRLDGDLYESTIQALDGLYPRLSDGGFCIIDDYNLPYCRQAVADYRDKHGITSEIVDIDGSGVFWRK
ncbi:TylF/MycF/NovP-related O-methyltransferase [Mycobacterium shigaense]|uniref:Methyltransferase MtfB n=1 Tax=Mycobacterium shigaense TaxID=722731 RepID=A0A1Z4EH87_9MYCO|nr:TylF/MycF/NovP-related O-methyltransferase [Mycobacterium shigaense]MEA1123029.1 TylF/MycF/NovP-related O-methyltransferase [Mycobacterium shigaense]PRI13448.1 macrocin O-methyltransferase [Mycobacterium shigaense]BAX92327.1 methyltransferase MtfB [Mycobacterium shigaense]